MLSEQRKISFDWLNDWKGKPFPVHAVQGSMHKNAPAAWPGRFYTRYSGLHIFRDQSALLEQHFHIGSSYAPH